MDRTTRQWVVRDPEGNFLTVTLMSPDLPMILMDDEAGQTQGDNNNAYCPDDEISWLDRTLLSKHAAVHRFNRSVAGSAGGSRRALSGRAALRGAARRGR